MSEVNYASGTGVCQKCGQQLLQLEDDGSKMCVVCKSRKLISDGPQVKTPAPTEEQMQKALSMAGISVGHTLKTPSTGQHVPEAAKSLAPQGAAQTSLSFDVMVKSALATMQNLPMPKDIRQFKTISKIIVQMESLIEPK